MRFSPGLCLDAVVYGSAPMVRARLAGLTSSAAANRNRLLSKCKCHALEARMEKDSFVAYLLR